jgi:hypothetical protein
MANSCGRSIGAGGYASYPLRECIVNGFNMDPLHCEHDYQLETVGGSVYLTGASVCRRYSFSNRKSHEQFNRHAMYPAHYQAEVSSEETISERASKVRARYRQRLEEQLTELTTESLACQLSQNERDES